MPITANILIGHATNQDGVYASHNMYLIEDIKPVWFLQETGIETTDMNGMCVTWIPRKESILEDGLLMIALYVVKSRDIMEYANRYIHSASGDKADLNEDIKLDNLEELRNKCRALNMGKKLVITVMEDSAISNQLHLLENYRFQVEVCTPQYTRRPAEQGPEYQIAGSLVQMGNNTMSLDSSIPLIID